MKKFVSCAALVACALQSFAYDSSSYVQEGLIAQWDGIDNAGNGYHDPIATVWKDLAGSYDMTLTTHGSWFNGTALRCDGVGGCAANYGAKGPTTYQTIEVVYRQTDALLNADGFIFDSGHNYHYAMSSKDGKDTWFASGTRYHVYWASREGSVRSVAATYASATEASDCSSVVSNGVVVADARKANKDYNAGLCHLMVGDRHTGKAYPFKGEIYAIRLYSGVLSAEQLAANARVDAVRFQDATPADVLDVCGAPFNAPAAVSPSYAGRDDLANGDTVTLTAPSGEIVAATGVKAYCTGFKLYNAAGTVLDSGNSLSYNYTHPGEYRKFEWQFAISNHVTVAGVDAGGTATVTDAWVGQDADFTFTVTPNDGRAVLSISNNADSETWTTTTVTKKIVKPTEFTVTYANCYYVSPTGNDSDDGKTHQTPKATIAAAVALADTGDSVVLLPGTYEQPAAAISPSKAINIYGEEGAENTLIYLSKDVTVFSLATAGITLRGITFYSNFSTKCGCPITTSKATTVSDCVIRDAYIAHSPCYTSGASVFRNILVCHVKGDGRYMTGFELNNGSAVIENCTVIACEGNNDTYGYACRILSGAKVRNCLFACNTNKSTAISGVYLSNGTLENCTVVDNVVLGSGTRPGVIRDAGTVKNCLIYGNVNRYGELNWSGAESAYTYTCTVPVPSGEGNVLAVNPDFSDPAAYDYSLRSGNTIDAGTTLAWHANARDLDGNQRVLGGAVDIGCFEYVPGPLSVSATPSVEKLVGEGTVTLTAFPAGADLDGLSFTWTVKDDAGTTVLTDTTSGAVLSHNFGYGRYTITLSVENAAHESVTWTGEKAFSVIPTTVHVATDSTPVFPYATSATAANDLPSALEATVPGSTVLVHDGTYTVNANIAVNGAVTIRSENGAEKTAFYTDKAIKIFNLNNSAAVLKDFTLYSDGKARSCTAVQMSGGLVTDCVVSNFYSNGGEVIQLTTTDSVLSNSFVTANRDTGRINLIQCTSGGGKVFNCRIVGNEGNNNAYGAAIQLYGGTATIRNCLIACNTNLSTMASAIGATSPASGSIVENCTIVGNHVKGSSSVGAVKVHANLKVRNCIIAENTNSGGEANWDTTGANVTYTCTTPEPCADAGNVEPSGTLFTDADYHIKAGILTDAGQNQTWMEGAVDLDGNPRIHDNGTVDLGCYEYVPGALEVSAAPSTAMLVGAGEVVLTAMPSVQGSDFVYTWTVTNQLGETVASVSGKDFLAYTNSYPIGVYSVSLTVTDGSQSADFYQGDLFAVKPAVVYVATDSVPEYPYDTKANAFNDVAEAIVFAESGMKVVVTDGVYTNGSNPTISKDVTVESENGPERTKVYGINTSIAWTLNSSGAVVKGLTLFSDTRTAVASTSQRQNHSISVLQGLLTDCVVSNWYSYYTTAFQIGGGTAAGIVSNCLITANKTVYRCHFMSMGARGLLTDSRVVKNSCDTQSSAYAAIVSLGDTSTIRNTLIADNRSVRSNSNDEFFGSVIDDRTSGACLIDHCTIVSNTSSNAYSPAIRCNSADNAAALTVRNSILWANTNSGGVLEWLSYPNCFTNCCCDTAGLDAQKGNIGQDPQFYYRATRSHPKYSLRHTRQNPSPCAFPDGSYYGCYEPSEPPGLSILVR